MTHDTGTDRSADPSRRLALGGALGAATAAMISARAAGAPTAPTGELSGKAAFITGGARGIGRASVEEMADAGANVVLFDIATLDLPNVQYPPSCEADLAAQHPDVECQISAGR